MAVKYQGGKAVPAQAHVYKLGDMYRSDFDYDGMLRYFRQAMAGKLSIPQMEMLYRSMEDVNYHTENRKLQAKIDEMRGGAGMPVAGMNMLQKEQVLSNMKYAGMSLNTSFNKASEAITYFDRAEAAMGKTSSAVQQAMQQLDVIRMAIKKVNKLVADIEAQAK